MSAKAKAAASRNSRGTLIRIQQEREAFALRKKALDEDMRSLKMGIVVAPNAAKVQEKIFKEPTTMGGATSDGWVEAASPSPEASPTHGTHRKRSTLVSTGRASTTSKSGTDSTKFSTEDSTNMTQQLITPSGTLVSDWSFVGDLASSPPIVKVNEVYETIRLLGRGSFGDVNLVKNIDDNKLYANKTIFCERETDMRDVLREMRFLRTNRHPCIIDIHDGFITTQGIGASQKQLLNIIMQYCETGDLDKVIKSNKKSKSSIPEGQITKWVIQIGLALHFLHENGIIHRDLKPCNVMLTEGGELVKVVDFGLALDVSDRDNSTGSTTTEAGTPYYTSPEMIQSLPCSFPTDCWSFGVMLHELLALDLPFHGRSTEDLVKSILNDTPPHVPPHYSADLPKIAQALLNKNPNLRLTMAGLLSDNIFANKITAFPQSYRPKALEERIRRCHTKQLSVQISNLRMSKNSLLRTVESCLPDAVTSAITAATEAAAVAVDAKLPLIASSAMGVIVAKADTVTASSTHAEEMSPIKPRVANTITVPSPRPSNILELTVQTTSTSAAQMSMGSGGKVRGKLDLAIEFDKTLAKGESGAAEAAKSGVSVEE